MSNDDEHKITLPRNIEIQFPPRVVFIIPYRDREQQRSFFTRQMNYLLEDKIPGEYRFFFSEQCFPGSFNRGGVKNAGFLAVKKRWPNEYKQMSIVFNDLDILPYTKNFLKYETEQGIIKHFYGFEYALGGLVSFHGSDFELVNGFPHFFGYGYEDSVLQTRVLNAKLQIDRAQFFDARKPEAINIMALNDGVHRVGNFAEHNQHLSGELSREGLSSVQKFEFEFDDATNSIKLNVFEFGRNEDVKNNIDIDLRDDRDIYRTLRPGYKRARKWGLF